MLHSGLPNDHFLNLRVYRSFSVTFLTPWFPNCAPQLQGERMLASADCLVSGAGPVQNMPNRLSLQQRKSLTTFFVTFVRSYISVMKQQTVSLFLTQ